MGSSFILCGTFGRSVTVEFFSTFPSVLFESQGLLRIVLTFSGGLSGMWNKPAIGSLSCILLLTVVAFPGLSGDLCIIYVSFFST